MSSVVLHSVGARRENSDFHDDVETVYSIKRGHFLKDEESDFALIEIAKSANTCTDEEEKKNLCWKVTPVRLPDPSLDIPDLATVRTLGEIARLNMSLLTIKLTIQVGELPRIARFLTQISQNFYAAWT